VDGVWKVADFGLTAEGTSHRPLETEFGRGTPGYRALELLREQPTYTNKVDIFSLGCILYEMVVGSKLFTTDIAALEHYNSKASVNIVFDDTFDAVSQTELSEIIHETTQSNPLSRPTAQTLVERFSKKGVISKEQSPLRQENPVPAPVRPALPETTHLLPVFRKVPSTDSLSGTDPGHHQYPVVFTVVNVTGTRIGTVSGDLDDDKFRVNLWDVSSGKILLQLLYDGSEYSSRANPTFSCDGRYFAVHGGGKTVEIYDANTGSFSKSVDGPSAQLSAIAVSKNMKRVAIALFHEKLDSTSGATNEDDVATLIHPGPGETMHIVSTYGVNGAALAYSNSGRYLFLIGTVLVDKKKEMGDEVRVWWDVMLRRRGKQVTGNVSVDSHRWTSPLYELPTNTDVFVRGFNIYGIFVVAKSTLHHLNYSISVSGGVIGSNGRSLLILGADTDVQFGNTREGEWVIPNTDIPKDPSDTAEYKYLLQYNGEEFELLEQKLQQGALFVAKLAWDDMPSLVHVKAVVETEGRIALFLDGEKFVYFEKE
jgi:hypothetical protein